MWTQILLFYFHLLFAVIYTGIPSSNFHNDNKKLCEHNKNFNAQYTSNTNNNNNTTYEIQIWTSSVQYTSNSFKKNYITEEKKEEQGECVLHSYAGLSAQRFQSMLHSRVLSGHAHLLLPDQEASQLLVFFLPVARKTTNEHNTKHWKGVRPALLCRSFQHNVSSLCCTLASFLGTCTFSYLTKRLLFSSL